MPSSAAPPLVLLRLISPDEEVAGPQVSGQLDHKRQQVDQHYNQQCLQYTGRLHPQQYTGHVGRDAQQADQCSPGSGDLEGGVGKEVVSESCAVRR